MTSGSKLMKLNSVEFWNLTLSWLNFATDLPALIFVIAMLLA